MSNFDAIKHIIDSCFATHTIDTLKEKRWTISKFEQLLNSLLNPELNSGSSVEDYLNLKFYELLSPFDGLENGKKIYCKCQSFESDDGVEYSFSALTDEMIMVDECYFSGMYDFYNTEYALNTVDGGTINVSMSDLIKSNLANDPYNPLKNVKCKSVIDLLYKPYYYSFTVSDESKAKEIAQIAGEDWWEVKVYSKKASAHRKSSNCNVFQGRLVYAASPLKFEDVEAEWVKNVNKKVLAKTANPVKYNLAKNSIVDLVLNYVFNNVTDSKISVYRVGEANAVLIKNTANGEARNIVFDLGIPNDCKLDESKYSIPSSDTQDKLQKIMPDVFIISHWHMDHFKAAYLLNRRVYSVNSKVIWLAPLYVEKEITCSADRLVKYLVVNNQIRFVREGYRFTNPQYSLYRINTTSSIAANNNNCLVLVANKTVLPGDCKFLDWIDNIQSTNQDNNLSGSIENIIVPHHGAIDALKDTSSIIKTEEIKQKLENILSKDRKKAIVSTGHGYENHPHPEVKKMFEDLGFKSFEETTSGDDTIDIE